MVEEKTESEVSQWLTSLFCISKEFKEKLMRYDSKHVGPDALWADAIFAWIDEMRALNRSEETLKTRWYQICRFSRFTHRTIDDVTTTQIREYLFKLPSLSTKKGSRTAISGFYDFCISHNIVSQNPAKAIPRIPTPHPTKLPCPDAAIFEGVSSPKKEAALMVELISETGMRRREVAQASSEDIINDLLGHSILIHGKGNKLRAVPLTDSLAKKLLALPSGYLFPGRFGGQCHPDHVSKLVRHATGGYSPHSLRRWFATRAYYASGQDLRAVQELLGHESIATTQRYVAAASNTRLRSIVSDVKKYRQGILVDPRQQELMKKAA